MEEKKYELMVVFGTEAVNAFVYDGMEKAQQCVENGDGNIIIKSFDTEAEREAYCQALEDSSGWMEYYWEKKH